MTPARSGNDPLVIGYLGLRKAVGVIGMVLPFVLAFGNALRGGSRILPSISAYYYSGMREVFVGSLCAIGVFLFSYRGYDRRDEVAGKIASASIIGVALSPTTPAGSAPTLTGVLHACFAVVYFLTLAFFALFLFRLTDQPGAETREKRARNRVYAACGVTIVVCLALIAIAHRLPPGSALLRREPVFWLESLAVVAFGVSWFVKGEGILEDTARRAGPG